jgi:hypothetical protein
MRSGSGVSTGMTRIVEKGVKGSDGGVMPLLRERRRDLTAPTDAGTLPWGWGRVLILQCLNTFQLGHHENGTAPTHIGEL